MNIDTRESGSETVRANKLVLLERMADSLAHEIKNPLHSMVINLEVLKRRIERSEADEALRYADVVARELERVNERVELLLRLARPDRGADRAAISEVVEELWETIEVEARHRGVSARWEPVSVSLQPVVPRAAARQLVLGLALGVIDELRGEGRLVLSTDRDGDRTLFTVLGIPTGDGAAESWTDFDPDHRPILSAASELAESLGARVEMRSSPDAESSGRALSFLLVLPA